jgi:hypothetical protein
MRRNYSKLTIASGLVFAMCLSMHGLDFPPECAGPCDNCAGRGCSGGPCGAGHTGHWGGDDNQDRAVPWGLDVAELEWASGRQPDVDEVFHARVSRRR